MEEYSKREIQKIKNIIEFYKKVKLESEEICKKYGSSSSVPDDFDSYSLKMNIMYYKASLEVYEYFHEKLGEKNYLPLGKYVGINLGFVYDNKIYLDLCLKNDEVESKLYSLVFGSHSGINEFVSEHFPDIFSVILGSTQYSHAFGTWDVKDAIYFFEHFGYECDDKNKHLYYDQERFDKDVQQAKKIIDWLFKLSENTELMNDVDNVLTTYFNTVFKYNKEK